MTHFFNLFQDREEYDHGADACARAGVRVRDPGRVRLGPGHLRQRDRVRGQAAQAEAAPLRHDQHARGGARLIYVGMTKPFSCSDGMIVL